MARIKEECLSRIKEAAEIVELVGKEVKLTRLGSSFRGLCPFHREKTPSFFVHPGKRIFRCFSCGEHGGSLQFVMKSKGLDFPDAVEYLAGEYGIKVEYEGRTTTPSYEADVFRALEIAARTYVEALNDPSDAGASKVREYLDKRKLSADTVGLFRIGFSGSGKLLLPALAKEGISPEIAEKAGLVYKKGGWVERFRDRIMFPILDARERVCGFGGRILVAGAGPKYVNSQDGIAYRKGFLLYGLKHAAEGIRNEKRVLVVEGYMDFLGLWEKGVRNAVATCGTALTEQHARILKRLSENIVLFFDGDNAGIRSAIRSGGVLYAEGVSPRMLVPPGRKDPDDWAKELSKDELRKETQESTPLIRYIEALLAKRCDLSSPSGRSSYVNLVCRYLRWITDPAERSAWTVHVARRAGLPEQVVLRAQVEAR